MLNVNWHISIPKYTITITNSKCEEDFDWNNKIFCDSL
jgi:hypothetical protein